MSFEELDDLMDHQDFWLPVAVLRSYIARDCIGGLSNAVRLLFNRTFLGTKSISTAGVDLDVGSGVFVFSLASKLFFVMTMLLQRYFV